MARISFEQRVSAMMLGDPLLRVLDPALILFWWHMVMVIHQRGTNGVLRVGSGFASRLEIAMSVRFGFPQSVTQSVTEMETHFETQITQLSARRLLVNADADGIGLPEGLMPTRREIANRLNGAKGGRPPKKLSDPTPAQDPRQRTATLAIAGGLAAQVVDGNPVEKAVSRTPAPSLSLDSISPSPVEASQAQASREISETEFRRVGRAAFDIPFDIARDPGNWGIARQWLADAAAAGIPEGARERLILATVMTVHERAKVKPKHMGYFTPAIGDAIAQFQPGDDVVASPEVERADRAYQAAVAEWGDRRRFNESTGPFPRREDFLARFAA